MPTNNEKLQHIIEQICTTGCDRVYEIIEILERQESIKETSQLSQEESNIVLMELKTIMSVYDQKN
jgi:hypothetical protein